MAILKLFLHNGIKFNNQVIKLFSQKHSSWDLNLLKLLVENGADPFTNDNTLVECTIYYNRVDILKYLISIKIDIIENISYDCLCDVNLEIIKLLLINNANPNLMVAFSREDTLLLKYYCGKKNLSGCELLLKYGADPKCCEGFFSDMDNDIDLLIELFNDHNVNIISEV